MVLFMVCSRGHYHEHMIQCALESLTGIPSTKEQDWGLGFCCCLLALSLLLLLGVRRVLKGPVSW